MTIPLMKGAVLQYYSRSPNRINFFCRASCLNYSNLKTKTKETVNALTKLEAAVPWEEHTHTPRLELKETETPVAS